MATIKKIDVPDLGTSAEVDVIELLVHVGDKVAVDTPLLTLESDKASMEVPSPLAGVIKEISIKVGDKVKNGQTIMQIEVAENGTPKTPEKPAPVSKPTDAEKTVSPAPTPVVPQEVAKTTRDDNHLYAGPAVRRLARELDIDLATITGSGEKGRITKDDIKGFVKSGMGSGGAGLGIAPAPLIDFSQYGEIEFKPLSKIKKLSGANLHRNWVTVPHVTQFDEADITEMEDFRNANKKLAESQGFKMTPLVFVMKAVIACLKKYPDFNASLDSTGQQLILKKYFHLGVAVDTPNGLVVAVVRDVDKKGLLQLAKELNDISEKARTKGLSLTDMQGACFTISSLGGIGGTAFTPIVNNPEVAILGVSKAAIKPVYRNGQFEPRFMLPLSLSYDHRVIDGAQGARFTTSLSQSLSDIKTLLL